MSLNSQLVLFLTASALLVTESLAINCYQCSGTDPSTPFQCNEWLDSDVDLSPKPCDNVYGAKYCIKHIGRFEGNGINCFQCSSSTSLDCSDGMVHMGGIQPQSCDNVFEARYCVKSTSLDGGIGAKRFCSSLDLGNYCNYVSQPGDMLTYRTCIFTCTGDGCNSSTSVKTTYVVQLLLALSMVLWQNLR